MIQNAVLCGKGFSLNHAFMYCASFQSLVPCPEAPSWLLRLAVKPVPNKPRFLRDCSLSLLKTLWENKKLLIINEQFLLFPQCFLSFCRTLHHFHQMQNCCLQSLGVWKSLKFVVWERFNYQLKKYKSDINMFIQKSFPSLSFFYDCFHLT